MARGDYYYYVVTVNAKGNRVVIGPYATDEQAEVDASKSEYDAEVVKLKTRNLARATQMVKGRDYSEMGDVNRATRFANHNARTRTGGSIKSNDILDKIRNTGDAKTNLGGAPRRNGHNGHSDPHNLGTAPSEKRDLMTAGFDSALENKLATFDI